MDSDGKKWDKNFDSRDFFFFSLSFVFLYTFVSLDWSLVNFTPTCVCVCVQDPNSCYPTVRCLLLLLLLVLLFFFLNTLCWFSCRFVFFLYFFRSVGTRLQGWTFTRPTRLEIIIYYTIDSLTTTPHCSLYIQQLRHSWICFKSTIVFWIVSKMFWKRNI